MITVNMKIADNISMGSDFISDEILLDQFEGCSIQVVWSGSPAGSMIIEFTNGKDAEKVWEEDPETESDITGYQSQLWNLSNLYHRLARVRFMHSSGTGLCDIIINGKGE